MLKLANKFHLPLEAITQTFAILAMRGSGKSNTAVVLAEEMFANALPWVAIDPKGDWWGMRSSADGKGPGLPIVVFGGLHGDVPLEATAGQLMADIIVDKRITCVLDCSEFSKGDQIKFLTPFAERLFGRNREPLHVFLEEADDYIPQRVMANHARCVGAFSKLVKQGRTRGIGCCMITQRSAVLNKDVLTQIETLVAMRTTSPQDRKAILGWVEYHALGKELVESLPSLENGEAWIWSPHWLKVAERVHVRRRRTFDSGATPSLGSKSRPPAKMADIDLGEIAYMMAATIERAKAEDPKELHKEIARLKRDYRQLEQRLKNAAPRIETVVETVSVVPPEVIDAIEKAGRLLNDSEKPFYQACQILRESVEKWREHGTRVISRDHRRSPSTKPAQQPRTQPPPQEPNGSLRKGARIILAAIAQHPNGCTKKQIRVLTKYRRSSLDAYISDLTKYGLIEETTDRAFLVTSAGMELLGDFEPLPTGERLRQYWLDNLSGGEQRIFEAVVLAYPATVSREQIDEATEYKRSSRDAYISRLAARQLIKVTGPGEVKASDELFL